jgi:hypothetical protein
MSASAGGASIQHGVVVDEREVLALLLGETWFLQHGDRREVEGLEAALSEEPRAGAARKLSVKEEALLGATACTTAPAGHAHWTMGLLADEMVRLTPHASLSSETVRRRLAENKLKPWQKKMWCIPKADTESSRGWRTCSISTLSRERGTREVTE